MYPRLALLPDRLTIFPPSLLTSCRLHMFCVDGEEARIQSALDAMFTAPSMGAVHYRVIGSKLFVSVAEIGKLQSIDAGDSQWGWMSEIDVTVWVMARVADSLAVRWIPMWLFVDAPPALITGREIYGFPKQIGRFDFTPQDRDARTFRIGAFVLATHAPDTRAAWSPLIEFSPSDAPAEPEAGSSWQGLEDFAARIARRLRSAVSSIDVALANAVSEGLGLGKSTLAFLKQFPDAADPRLACYQGVIEADCEVRAIRSAGLTSRPYRANILSYASHPFNQQLGIGPGVKEIGHGAALDFDFTLGLGREIWRAP